MYYKYQSDSVIEMILYLYNSLSVLKQFLLKFLGETSLSSFGRVRKYNIFLNQRTSENEQHVLLQLNFFFQVIQFSSGYLSCK